MGIKHFASWFNTNFKEFVIPFSKSNFPLIHIDTFLIDLNGIFHTSAQRVFKYGNYAPPPSLLRKTTPQNTEKLTTDCYNDVIHTIDLLVSITRPTSKLVLAIDGVAPMAKQQQQRQRRYKSAIESSSGDVGAFNSTCISTGTKFMDGLSKHINFYIERKISSGEWTFDVVFTNEKCPGEGEHKLINYIRLFGGENETFCLNALDADLFMLSLGTMKEKFYLLREEMYNPSIDYMYVDIGKTRTKLVADFAHVKDFILVCFLCGNDFLPNIPSINICEQGLTRVLEIYKLFEQRIVDDDNNINVGIFMEFLARVAESEEKMFARKITHSSQYMPDSLVTSMINFDFAKYRDAYNKNILTVHSTMHRPHILKDASGSLTTTLRARKIGSGRTNTTMPRLSRIL